MLTTSVEAICLNYRPKKDNTYPLMLRLTKSGKKKYVSSGISVKEKDWDREVIYLPCFISGDNSKTRDWTAFR